MVIPKLLVSYNITLVLQLDVKRGSFNAGVTLSCCVHCSLIAGATRSCCPDLYYVLNFIIVLKFTFINFNLILGVMNNLFRNFLEKISIFYSKTIP